MTGRTDLPPAKPPVSPVAGILSDYTLAVGDNVEVTLLVSAVKWVGGPVEPLRVEGKVAGASPAMLLIGGRDSDVRVPWSAIATIRNAPAAHPAL